MNSSNQDNSEYNITYDPNVAYEFFRLFGKLESVNEGKNLFVLGQKTGFLSLKNDKTYLLLQGKVSIKTPSGTSLEIEPGELFGESAAYTTRNATATAKLASKLISLTEKQLLTGLQKKPEFLLMLMDNLIKYLEKTDSEILFTPPPPETNDGRAEDRRKDKALSSKILSELKQKLGDKAIRIVHENQVIFKEGTFALLMYVILDGYMNISIGDKVIWKSGPGEIVGEIGLITHRPRTANVTTETRCSLLSINRQTLMDLIETLPSFGIALLRVLGSRLHIRSSVADYNPADNEILVEEGDYKDSDWK